MQRIACGLIGASLAVISALVALLLSDAFAPGRLPPMLAFWAASGAGGLLIAGLLLLERGSRHGPDLGRPDLGRPDLGRPDLRTRVAS